MKKNDIWSFKNIDEYFDPRFGLVYRDFGNNAFEIITGFVLFVAGIAEVDDYVKCRIRGN